MDEPIVVHSMYQKFVKLLLVHLYWVDFTRILKSNFRRVLDIWPNARARPAMSVDQSVRGRR